MQFTNVRQAAWEDVSEAIETCYALGWTDGLPVVPPTVERVETFLNYVQRAPDDVLGTIPERRRTVTASKVAANAVMAGCRPEYMPVVMAATEAMLDPVFNLIGPSSSQGSAALLVIVNGPIAHELGMNCRNNVFGPGNRANATIGRAVRLILMNACASIPGLFDRSIFGEPGKYSYCIAENEAESPWEPLHVERGFAPTQSTVTVFACWGPRQVRCDHGPEVTLESVADVAASLGTSLCTADSVGDTSLPIRQGQIALTVAGASSFWNGWSKQAIRAYLHPRIRRSMADLKRVRLAPGPLEPGDEQRYVPLVPEPEDILIVYAGAPEGAGYRCAVIPSELPKVASTAVTTAIRLP